MTIKINLLKKNIFTIVLKLGVGKKTTKNKVDENYNW